jgi:hypothetical protein
MFLFFCVEVNDGGDQSESQPAFIPQIPAKPVGGWGKAPKVQIGLQQARNG